jgi:hypothetical protein
VVLRVLDELVVSFASNRSTAIALNHQRHGVAFLFWTYQLELRRSADHLLRSSR